MRAYAHGLTMAVACVAFSLALVPAIAYADEAPCMNEGDNASSITQTAGAEIPDENAGGEQDSSADALQVGNDSESVEEEPIADGAEEPESPSSRLQPMPVDQQPQTPNPLGTTSGSTFAPGNEFDVKSDLADRTVDPDTAAGCIDNAPTSKGALTAPKSQQPAPAGVGDENEVARPQMMIAIDYEPVPKGVTAALKAHPNSEIGLSTFELYWQYKSGEGGDWVDVLDASGERLMVQTLRVPTSDETIGTVYRACMRADDPVTGERVEVHSKPVTITEGSITEGYEDQPDDPILLTTLSDDGGEEPPIESPDPDHGEAWDDTGESQPALETHASVSAIYGAPSAPDRNASSALPPTGDAVPFAIPAALAAIAALAACVSLIVRRRIDALA